MAVPTALIFKLKQLRRQHRSNTNLIRIRLFYRQNRTSLGKNCNFVL